MENKTTQPQESSYYGLQGTGEEMVEQKPLMPGSVYEPKTESVTNQEYISIVQDDGILESEFIDDQRNRAAREPRLDEPSIPRAAVENEKVHHILGSRPIPVLLALAIFFAFATIVSGIILINRYNESISEDSEQIITSQAYSIPAIETSGGVVDEIRQKQDETQLIVKGNVIATQKLGIYSGEYLGQLSIGNLNADRTYVLPDSSGQFCLDSNNCNYAVQNDVVTSIGGLNGAITLGGGLSVQDGVLVSAVDQTNQTTVLNGVIGQISIRGTDDQVQVVTSGTVITLTTPQNIASSSTPSFQSITLAATGTQNGNIICDQSNNCGFSTVSNAYIQGGNSFGATAVLGTTDTQALELQTNGNTRVSIDSSGDTAFNGNVTISTGTLTVSSSGILGTVEKFRVNTPTTVDNLASSIFATGATTRKGLVIQGALSQTANLQEWQGSTGTVLASVSSTGVIRTATLGSADTDTLLCRNSSNQIATCNSSYDSSVTLQDAYQNDNTILATNAEGDIDLTVSEATNFSVDITGTGSFLVQDGGTNILTVADGGLVSVTGDLDVSSQLQVGNNGDSLDNCRVLTFAIPCVAAVEIAMSDSSGDLTVALNTANTVTPNSNVASPNVGIQNYLLLGDGTDTEDFTSLANVSITGKAYGGTTGTIATLMGVGGSVTNAVAGTITLATGGGFGITNGAGSITTGYALQASSNAAGGTIGTAIGLKVDSSATSGGGVINNNYGALISAQIAGSSNYGIAIEAAGTQTLWLSSNADNTTAASGIAFGASRDSVLYRNAADTLRTGSAFIVDDRIGINNATQTNKLNINTLITVDPDAQLAVSTNGISGKGVVVQGANGQVSNLQEWQDNLGNVLASISADGELTATTVTVNGSVTINGHIITGNSSGTTTISAGSNAGAGAVVSITGNDASGLISVTTGTGTTSGELVMISFANSYGSAPNVTITPANSSASALQYFVGSSGTTTFSVDSNNPPTDSTSYEYYYQVMQ